MISGISTTPNTVCKKEYFNAEDRSKYATQIVNNFDPFVMLPKTTNLRFGSFSSAAMAVEIKERSWSVSSYSPDSYLGGFNGQEKEIDISGVEGGHVVFSYRIYDARLGRFLSVDPLFKNFAYNSTYAFAENKVILCIDLEGLEALPAFGWKTCGFTPGRMGLIVNKSDEILEQSGPLAQDAILIPSGIVTATTGGGFIPVAMGVTAAVGGSVKFYYDLKKDYTKSKEIPTTVTGTVLVTVNYIQGDEAFSKNVIAAVEIIEGVVSLKTDVKKLIGGDTKEKIYAALKVTGVIKNYESASESIKDMLIPQTIEKPTILNLENSDLENQRDNTTFKKTNF